MPYFDNSATSYPKPEVFYANLAESFRKYGVNASRGKYKQSSKMKEVEERLRANLASETFFNVCESRKVIFTASCTIALNQVLQGLDYANIKTVYISPFEHNAVYRTIMHLQSMHSFDLEIIPFNEFEWAEAKTKLHFSSKKPDLVILNHASNVFGNILPVEKIFSLAKEHEAITILDCAQSAGVIDVNLKKLNADFACFAGHKSLYGPSGIGGFAINPTSEDNNLKNGRKPTFLHPILFGGTGINSEETAMPSSLPERYEVGSMNSLGIIGLDLSVNWLLETGLENINKQKKENFKKLLSVLKTYDEIKLIYGENNVGVVSCQLEDNNPQEMGMFLDQHDISVRVGMHCAPLAHKHMGTAPAGTVRFSTGYFNTDDNFEAFDEALYEIL